MDSGTDMVRLRLNFPIVAAIDGVEDKAAISPLRCDCPPLLAIDEVEVSDGLRRSPGFLEFPCPAAIGGMQGLPDVRTEPAFLWIEELHRADAAQVLHRLSDNLPRLPGVFCAEQDTGTENPAVFLVNEFDLAQIFTDAAMLRQPRFSAIGGMRDDTA